MTEEQWDGRAPENSIAKPSRLLPLWIFLLLPFVAALILMMHHGGAASIELWFILCALVVGFYAAKLQNRSGLGMILMGMVFSVAAVFFYAIMAVGLLFVGCVVALNQSR